MIFVEICIGSSCHIRGSEKIIDLFQKALADHGIEDEVALSGSFCTGQCNRVGVSVVVDGEVTTGVTPENFKEFFEGKILKPIAAGRN